MISGMEFEDRLKGFQSEIKVVTEGLYSTDNSMNDSGLEEDGRSQEEISDYSEFGP